MPILDIVITIVVILALVIVIWARVTHQTVPELIRDLMDIAGEKKEDATDEVALYYQ